jgi:hypothetical protein
LEARAIDQPDDSRKDEPVTHEDYRKALDSACREYEALTEQRNDIDKRMAQLAQSIGSLTKLCGFEPTVPWGLTDAVRMVLKAAGHPLTPVEMRAQLEAMGIDLSKYSSDLAAIHTVVKRLIDAGEAGFVAGWGKPRYQWTGSLPQVGQAIANVEALKKSGRRTAVSEPGPRKREPRSTRRSRS